MCYLVAGLAPGFWDPGSRLCAVGADHRSAPRSLACVAALQRTEVLEWARLPGARALLRILPLSHACSCLL